MGSIFVSVPHGLRLKMHILLILPILFSISYTQEVVQDNVMMEHGDQETNWDPWTPCEDDSDCPEYLMCNTRQNRCTECMDSEDCPPCMEDDCPHQGEGVCVYGDHCCSADYC
eukprot:TRINITY_DN35455_c0_g1_i1.p1 TRINITY_DN35455_c0_g1~~TRINITY_DN35455_c0_g1_i1.p1  ORF type:complete len:121 (-),score=19.29 TRINITY_DN35455_c0_g1_i1:74-412(-)